MTGSSDFPGNVFNVTIPSPSYYPGQQNASYIVTNTLPGVPDFLVEGGIYGSTPVGNYMIVTNSILVSTATWSVRDAIGTLLYTFGPGDASCHLFVWCGVGAPGGWRMFF
jgi:hypothetical protein